MNTLACGGGIRHVWSVHWTQTVWWAYLFGAYTEHKLCGGGICSERTLNTDYVVGVFAWSVHWTRTVWWGYLHGAYTEHRLCGGGICLDRTMNTDLCGGGISSFPHKARFSRGRRPRPCWISVKTIYWSGDFQERFFLFDPSLTSGKCAALMKGHCLRRRPCIKQHMSGGRQFHRKYHRQLPPHLTRHETLHAAELD